MSKYLFYPGCSMESNALAYHEFADGNPRGTGHRAGRNRGLELLRRNRVPGYQHCAGLCTDQPQPGAGSQTIQRDKHRSRLVQRLLPEPGQSRSLYGGTTYFRRKGQ